MRNRLNVATIVVTHEESQVSLEYVDLTDNFKHDFTSIQFNQGVSVLFVDYGEVRDIIPIYNEIHHEIGVESAVHEPIMCLRLVLVS